ncbi:hypothetical protein CANDROIZ_280003 [Candidatus Roizmanbacteria bacterium]|nr:hypothetical protein CANDROIZ_280003 [Candidatus Roizmanbacteria bacterium]
MDQNSAVIDEKKKSKILNDVVRALIDAYGSKSISYFEMKKAATYILDHFQLIKTQNDLIYFLENLNGYWLVFKNVMVMEKLGSHQNKEEEMIERLSKYIKNIPTK